MRRDKRVHDNYCIELAYTLSYESKTKLYVAIEFNKLRLNERQRTFVIEGLQEVESVCSRYNLYFDLIDDVARHVTSKHIDCIVLDFSPLRECRQYEQEIRELCEKKKMSLYVVDANNMVPCKLLDVYKRTGKSVKINLNHYWRKYLRGFKVLRRHRYNDAAEIARQSNKFPDKRIDNVFKGGYNAGMQMLHEFFEKRFTIYHEKRNNPEFDAQSYLAPWISMGHISSQRVIYIAVNTFDNGSDNLWTFINEVFVWKETADHFCLHEQNYDNLNGALPWARSTLRGHAKDKRDDLYDLDTLKTGQTHSKLWNAAQRQLLQTGMMHLYCRMFWAKQLLKWIQSPDEAVRIGCLLNDTYSLDGNSPNGYLAIMWAMCGTMDQGFKERPITGKIRPMNEFKAPKYIKKWSGII